MTGRCKAVGLALLAGLGAGACEYDHDIVLPGHYGEEGAKATTIPSSPSTEQAQSAQLAAPVTMQSVTSSQAAPASMAMAAAGSGGVGGVRDMPRTMPRAGSSAPQPAGAPAGPCDLTGRWLATSHLTTDALGALQFAYFFEYLEIEQQGDAFTVTKGFLCDTRAVGDGSLAADVDFRGARESLPEKVRYDGRRGTSTQVAGGCQVELERWYTVRGVTTPYYLDPANPLPTAEQMATADTPGWEDWDGDGNPGITGELSGVVSGKIFVGPRMWTAMSGAISDVSSFRLPVKWGQEQNVLGFDGSPLLGTEAAIGPDPETHFAELARLAPDQATGDLAAVCEAVVRLAPQLTPGATDGL